MTSDSISRWLRSPEEAPDAYVVRASLQSWPWFVPARLMEAALLHRESAFSPEALAKLQLYGSPWVAAYSMLTAADHALHHKPAPQVHVEPASLQTQIGETSETDDPEESTEEAQHIPLQPPFTEDYFRHEGLNISEELPEQKPAEPQTLMVMMSFSEWLVHFKTKTEQEESEAREKRALRSMWQQEKLAAALEDEPDEIPEDVFEMAVTSITREGDLASESLALILEKQEKWGAAADMYRKLAAKNPAKSSYFAARAEAAKKRLS